MLDLIDTMVVWNPGNSEYPPKGGVAGAVAVVRHPDTNHRTAAYGYSDGACNVSEWKRHKPERRLSLLMTMFVTMVVRDGVPAENVHKAFLAIKEYVAIMPMDVPGVAALAKVA